MDELLHDMTEQGKEEQRRIDRITGYLILAGSLLDSRSLGIVLSAMDNEGEEASREGEKLRAVLRKIREHEQHKQRSELMRSRTMSLILLLGMVLLLIWMPARAQESATLATNTAASEIAPLDATALPVEVTVEPTQEVQPPVVVQPNEDSHLLELVKQALPWIGVVAITFIIMLGTLGHQFIVNLGKSAPVPVREVAISAGSEILKQAEGYVMKTTTPLDDIGLKEVRRLFDQYIAEIRATGQIPLPPTSDQSGQVG